VFTRNKRLFRTTSKVPVLTPRVNFKRTQNNTCCSFCFSRIPSKHAAAFASSTSLVQQEANFLFRSSYSDGEVHFCSLLSQSTHTARSNLALCLAIFLSSSTLLPSSILIKQKQGKIIVISLFLRVQSKQSSETTNNILIKLAISHGAEQLMLVCYSRQGISLAHCQAAINTYPNTQ